MKKIALITGGQRGIGLGIARELADAGYDVALTAEVPADTSEVVSTLEELGSFPIKALYFQHDLREVDAINDLLDQVEKDLGKITTFVSNAGVPAKVRGELV